MNRNLRAALLPLVALALGIGFVSDASAYKLVEKTISIRKYKTNTGSDERWVQTSSTAGYIDSSYFSWNVTGASTAPMKDTTITFTLDNWALIPVLPGLATTAVDSIYGFDVVITPYGTASTAAFDTATATLQGSMDGTNWVSGTAYGAGGPYLLDVGSSNSCNKQFNFIWSLPCPGTPINTSMGHFRFFRLILGGGGIYGGVDSGQFQAVVRWWTETDLQDRR